MGFSKPRLKTFFPPVYTSSDNVGGRASLFAFIGSPLKDALDLGYEETWHNSHMHMDISMEVLCVVKYASLLNYLIHII
jgi:hypothetical protein